MKIKAAVFFLILIFTILSRIPISVDYRHFMFATQGWLEGNTPLYDTRAGEFYYLPWALWITFPLSFMPQHIGQTIFNLVSFISILWGCNLMVGELKAWQWFLIYANLFTINLFYTAQWDGLILLGIGLSWWSLQKRNPWLLGSSLMLAATKPINVILPILLLCWLAVRTLEIKKLFQASIIPILLITWSFWACKVDWPLRYVQYTLSNPPPAAYNISLWKNLAFNQLEIAILICVSFIVLVCAIIFVKKHNPLEAILFLLTTNLLVSPYVLSYHFVTTSPGIAWVSKNNWLFGMVIYGLMLCILLGVARVSLLPPFICYPFIVSVSQVVVAVQQKANQTF